MPLILVTLEVFHLDISGNDDNDEQPLNIPLILVIFVIPFNLISNTSFFVLNNPKVYFSFKSCSFPLIINLQLFFDCCNLLSLPDIHLINTINVTNMNSMFSNCTNLSSLPDISNWNTNNVTNMSCMFYQCSSLTSLPDISKWNTNNVIDMSGMFYKCSSLTSLPDISNWNTNKVTDKEDMFFGIKIKNIKFLSFIFYKI